jgi:nucleotide-binding universal stress UspA family protein
MDAIDHGQGVNFKNVLLATDFSPVSTTALLYALSFARRWRARLFVTHIVNPTAIFGHDERAVNDAWRQAHEVMTDQLIAGRLEGVENHVVVRKGEVWPELRAMMQEFQIDLLVTGTRGRSGMLKMLLGSTAEVVFRHCVSPILTIGPRVPPEAPPEGPKRILYSTGFKAPSLHAGGYAMAIAERNQAELTMLHVIKELPKDAVTREQLRLQAEERMRHLLPPDLQLPSPPETRVAFGAVGPAILANAEQRNPDLIVLGLRRHEPEQRGVWQTAYEIVSNARCPVLSVRIPE